MKLRLLPIVIVLFLVSTLLPFDNALAVTVTIQPSTKDSYVVENNPSANFGTVTGLIVSRDGDGDEVQSLVEFSMASIPTGATIDSALFGLYIDNNIFNTDIRMQAKRIVATWSETSVTWNFQPPTVTTDAAVADSGTADSGWIEWNITAIVDDWVNNGILNEGIEVEHIAGGATQGTVTFFSREYATAAERPRLVVIYTSPEPEVVSYLVYLAGGIDNVTSWLGATGTEFNVILENRGNVELTFVNLELYDHTPAIVTETNLTNIEINEARNHQFIYTHGLGAGEYSWQFQAHYQGDIEYWNFSLNISS